MVDINFTYNVQKTFKAIDSNRVFKHIDNKIIF